MGSGLARECLTWRSPFSRFREDVVGQYYDERMSTPGQPHDSGQGPSVPGVDNYAETMARQNPFDPPSLSKRQSSTEQAAEQPSADYPSTYSPTAQYPSGQYPSAQYPSAQYPSGQYPAAPNQQYGATYPVQAKGGGSQQILMIAAIALIVVLLGAAGVVWFKVANSGNDTASQDPAVVTQQQQTTETVTSVVVDPETDAATKLRNQIDGDASAFRTSLGQRWAAQISAKRPGLNAEGRIWDNQAILSEFQAMQGRYPQVRLLDSSAWPVFSEGGWMVTVSAQGFPTPQSALSWCASNGLDKDHCFAKFISSTQGPDGSTLYQR